MRKFLTPEEAKRRFDEDPASLMIPLDAFIKAGFTFEELLGELRSGRLVAYAENKEVLAEIRSSGSTSIAGFAVSAEDIVAWMTHPETPPDLVDKFTAPGRPH